MGVFDNLEKKLEGAVNGAFARAFKGDVQPVEITARLQRELDAEAKLLVRDRKLVPNDFTVGLSASTTTTGSTPYTQTLNAEIIPQLRDYAADAGYIFNGPVTIDYALDAALPIGRFTVASQAVAAADAAGRRADRRSAGPRLVLEVNGIRHPLTPPGFTHRPRHRRRPAHQRPRHLPAARPRSASSATGERPADRHRGPRLHQRHHRRRPARAARRAATTAPGSRSGHPDAGHDSPVDRCLSSSSSASSSRFLALLWLFILFAGNVIRTDLFGRKVPATELAAAAEPPRRSRAEPKRRRAPAEAARARCASPRARRPGSRCRSASRS